MTDSINTQISDAVRHAAADTIGVAPSQSNAMLDTVMAETLGMAMHNAVGNQRNVQMLGAASLAATCAKLLGVTPPPPPSPVIPPSSSSSSSSSSGGPGGVSSSSSCSSSSNSVKNDQEPKAEAAVPEPASHQELAKLRRLVDRLEGYLPPQTSRSSL